MWDALRDLGAERIGHGTSSVQDPELMAHLVEHRHPARGLPDVQHRHPRGATGSRTTRSGRCTTPGVTVTVNSDDPPMFGTTLNREYEIAADLLDLDERGIGELAKNAVHASFMSAEDKGKLAAEIDAYTTAMT